MKISELPEHSPEWLAERESLDSKIRETLQTIHEIIENPEDPGDFEDAFGEFIFEEEFGDYSNKGMETILKLMSDFESFVRLLHSKGNGPRP